MQIMQHASKYVSKTTKYLELDAFRREWDCVVVLKKCAAHLLLKKYAKCWANEEKICHNMFIFLVNLLEPVYQLLLTL